MLDSILYAPNGNAYLNSLRRFVLSSLLVPTQENLVINAPAANASGCGQSLPIPIQGPEDAKTECFSLTGVQGAVNVGIGTITTDGITATITGSGTKFTTQLTVGTVIQAFSGALLTYTIASVTSDTVATATAVPVALTGANFSFYVPVINDVRDRLFCTIEDMAYRRMLMNRDVPVRHVFGSTLYPLLLRETLLLEVDQTILLRLFNYSTQGPASLAPQMEARKWQIEALKRSGVAAYIDGLRQRKTLVNPYWLTLDDGIVTVPANGTVQKFFTVTGDITICMFNLYGHAISSGRSGNTQEKVLLEFFDSTNNRALQVQPVTLNTACGDAETPFVLPSPIISEPARQIGVKIRNLITDASTDVMLTMHGVAMYTGMSGRGGVLTSKSLINTARDVYRTLEPQIIPASPRG